MFVELISIELFKNNCVMAPSKPPLNFKCKVMFSFKVFVSLLKPSHAYCIDPIVVWLSNYITPTIVNLEQNLK